MRVGLTTARSRARSCFTNAFMDLPTRFELQEARDDARHALPVVGLRDQLLSARLRQRIELRLAIVLRRTPRCRNPAFLDQTNEAEVDRPLIHPEGLVAQLLDSSRDPVPVER